MIGKCVDGATVIDVCQFGDARLLEETAKVFKKDKEMKKGIHPWFEIDISLQSFATKNDIL